MEDTIPEWTSEKSDEQHRGIWVSRSHERSPEMVSSAALGAGVMAAIAASLVLLLLAFSFVWISLVCLTVWIAATAVVWSTLAQFARRERFGACDLFAPYGAGSAVFRAKLLEVFEGEQPAARPPVLKGHKWVSGTYEEWKGPSHVRVFCWRTVAGDPHRIELRWNRRADAREFRLLKGRALLAVRAITPPPPPDGAVAALSTLKQGPLE